MEMEYVKDFGCDAPIPFACTTTQVNNNKKMNEIEQLPPIRTLYCGRGGRCSRNWSIPFSLPVAFPFSVTFPLSSAIAFPIAFSFSFSIPVAVLHTFSITITFSITLRHTIPRSVHSPITFNRTLCTTLSLGRRASPSAIIPFVLNAIYFSLHLIR